MIDIIPIFKMQKNPSSYEREEGLNTRL